MRRGRGRGHPSTSSPARCLAAGALRDDPSQVHALLGLGHGRGGDDVVDARTRQPRVAGQRPRQSACNSWAVTPAARLSNTTETGIRVPRKRGARWSVSGVETM